MYVNLTKKSAVVRDKINQYSFLQRRCSATIRSMTRVLLEIATAGRNQPKVLIKSAASMLKKLRRPRGLTGFD